MVLDLVTDEGRERRAVAHQLVVLDQSVIGVRRKGQGRQIALGD
jgi:hypothetical protein